MAELGIREEDLIERFVLGTGSGGQKINKTSSCVYLKHIPTGIEVKCQASRSREENRELAREKLCVIFKKQREAARSEKQQAAEKLRRQKRPRPRRVKEKMLEHKKHLSKKKSLRQPPQHDF